MLARDETRMHHAPARRPALCIRTCVVAAWGAMLALSAKRASGPSVRMKLQRDHHAFCEGDRDGRCGPEQIQYRLGSPRSASTQRRRARSSVPFSVPHPPRSAA
jgi:hypothetical protein